jgi:hypothetical protein
MALCDILVCLDAIAAGDGRLELALNLAQASKAHLTAVYALPGPRGWAAPLAGMGLPPTVLGPVSPEGARAIGGKPISAAPPVARVLPEAERVDGRKTMPDHINSSIRHFHTAVGIRAADTRGHKPARGRARMGPERARNQHR